jgi:hypothetical protein
MIAEIKNHLGHYTILAIWLMVGLLWFVFEGVSPFKREVVVGIFSIGYFGWGMWHHSRIGEMDTKIVLEYGLIALLTMVLVGGLVLQR